MAYSLTAAQVTALTRERDSLQETVNTYDSEAFITATNAGVTSANEVDQASLAVWTSVVQSTDGTQPRETVLSQLDGITPNRSVIFSDMNKDQPLYDMGAIQPVISDLTDEATTVPRNIENSRRIRLSLNRYYPDVDNKDVKPDSDTRNVFPDHPWFAYAPGIGSQKDYQDLNTLFQAGAFGNGGRGTPAMITGFGPDPAGITAGTEASGANAQTSISDDGANAFIGDNERFFIYLSNFLSTAHSGGSLAAGTNTVSGVDNRSAQGVVIAGTATLFSQTPSTGGMTGTPTYNPAVGDILSLNGGVIRIVTVSLVSAACPFTPSTSTPPGQGSSTCNRTTNIRYTVLSSTPPSNGNFSAVTQGAQAINANKRAEIEGIKRFKTAIVAGGTNIATPAITNQGEITTEIGVIEVQLGTQTSLIYQAKYNIGNTRCNWNNGTLSALISRENSRLNLFSPATLLSQGLITTITDFVNEYTRTIDKIEEFQAILDGAS